MNANSLNFVCYPFSHSLLMAIVELPVFAHLSPIVRIDAATARYPSAL